MEWSDLEQWNGKIDLYGKCIKIDLYGKCILGQTCMVSVF